MKKARKGIPYLSIVKYTATAATFSGVVMIAVANLLGDVKSTMGYTGLAIALPSVAVAGIAWMLDSGSSPTPDPDKKETC